MFLKEIHIQNFKGFDDLHLSFTNEKGEARKHTILLGENGTGKSNQANGNQNFPTLA